MSYNSEMELLVLLLALMMLNELLERVAMTLLLFVRVKI